jgi:hypothetical protein
MADDNNQHEIWDALSHQVNKLGLLAPEVMPQAALDLASLAIGYAVALGCDPRAVLRAVAPAVLRAVEPDLQKRCPLCAWAVGQTADDSWWCHSCECEWEDAAVTPVDLDDADGARQLSESRRIEQQVADAHAAGVAQSEDCRVMNTDLRKDVIKAEARIKVLERELADATGSELEDGPEGVMF